MGFIDADACFELGARQGKSGYGEYVMDVAKNFLGIRLIRERYQRGLNGDAARAACSPRNRAPVGKCRPNRCIDDGVPTEPNQLNPQVQGPADPSQTDLSLSGRLRHPWHVKRVGRVAATPAAVTATESTGRSRARVGGQVTFALLLLLAAVDPFPGCRR